MGTSNGTALWLGAQLLSVYAASALDARRPKAVELGSGVGLTALALSSLGYDVLATDTDHVCDSILRRNIAANLRHLPVSNAGSVQVRVLDWHVPSDAWNWHNPSHIASRARSPIPLTRVPARKLGKALERAGIQWQTADWDGVEIWKGIGRQ